MVVSQSCSASISQSFVTLDLIIISASDLIEDLIPSDRHRMRTILFVFLNLEQRRLCQVNVALFDQLRHEAVQERRASISVDVRAVDIGIGHDDDLVVAQFGDIEIVVDSGSECRNLIALISALA